MVLSNYYLWVSHQVCKEIVWCVDGSHSEQRSQA